MKSDTPISESSVSSGIEAPRWMTKAEKAIFERVITARNEASNPVLPAEFDLLCDYISSRGRIEALRRFLKSQLVGARDFPPSQRHAAGLIRQIDTSTSLSRRLARELGLTPSGGGNE
jgi:phage terminase small subunit